jgi:hypothetical protein
MTELNETPDLATEDAEDTEGHFIRSDVNDADDTEGHLIRREDVSDAEDADDTEGHNRRI